MTSLDTTHPWTAEELGLDDSSLARRKSMIRVIKRYESRKLYDTEESRYVSLDDIALWVREGQEIQVLDNATSHDVTAQILTQVIHEEGKRGTAFLPTDLLHELVRGGEKWVSAGVEQVQGRVDRLVRSSIDRLAPVRRAREEMVHLRERLSDLERTLQKLESETDDGDLAAAAKKTSTAAKKAAPKKAAAKKPAAKKPTTKKAAAKEPAPKKPAAKSKPKTATSRKSTPAGASAN